MFPDPGRGPGFARPRLVLSRCLDLEACRYNAAVIQTPLVRRLEPVVDLVPVCPEVELGLGVPREPIRLVRRGGSTALMQPATGRDLTGDMAGFADAFLGSLPDVEGFLLKARSPSCGVHGVKLFLDTAAEILAGRDVGMFARAVLSRFPHHPAEHEGRLTNPRLLDHFLTRLFALADVRRARAEATLDALVSLQRRHRLTHATFEPEQTSALDAIVAAATDAGSATEEDWSRYAHTFRVAIAPPPSVGAHLAVMRDVARAWSPLLDDRGRRELGQVVDGYGAGTTPRWTTLGRMRVLALGVDRPQALDAYLAPYPAELAGA
jgi:uncharacterized protein YbbK (DUF523 family)/uncharacterized protein YbgA (DUF1722 family)